MTTTPAQPAAAEATPVRRFTLASWVSILGRHCYLDFVRESDYAKLERDLDAALACVKRMEAEYARMEAQITLPASVPRSWAEIADENTALRAQLAQAREDSARLDWLDQQSADRNATLAVMVRRSEREPISWAGVEWSHDSDLLETASIRAAIDLAKARWTAATTPTP